MTVSNQTIAVIGGGLSGLTQALLLAQSGIQTICVDPYAGRADDRTIALSYGSIELLKQANIWDELKTLACPINHIDILDGNSPVLLDFDAYEIGDRINDEPFGWIVENKHLAKVLHESLLKQKSAKIIKQFVASYNETEEDVVIELNNGEVIHVALVIGADGRQSFTREYMEVGARQWSYHQEAVVCIVTHEKPHNNAAVEHFLPAGPFALLPMLDDENGHHRSALVWTQDAKSKDKISKFNDDVFTMALSERIPSSYGAVTHVTPRRAYPLNLIHAYKYVMPRFALIADAAHGIHPIAGQGLNIGLRDVKALTDILVQADGGFGDISLLRKYEKERRFDNMSMAAATDALNKLFANNILPIRLLRKIGLKAVQKLPKTKRFFMSQAAGLRH